MSMIFPWALLGLLVMPALLGLYMLRRRHRPLPVSSLFLWRTPHLRSGGGRRLSRLDHALLLLLELLMATLLTMAATGPGCRWQRPMHRVAVVLDDSASMAARYHDGSPSPSAQAAAWLLKDLHAHRPFDCAVVVSGLPPRLASASVGHPRDLAALLDAWRPRQPDHDVTPALRLARQTVGEHGQVLFLTDHAPPDLAAPDGVHWLAFGTPVGNAGITAASRETDPLAGRETIIAEIIVSGAVSSVILECHHGERILARRELRTPGDPAPRDAIGEFREIFSVDDQLDGPVRLSLVRSDGLAEDNEAILLPTRPKPVRIQTVMTAPDSSLARLMTHTVDALGGAVAPVSTRPHLIVTDRTAELTAMRAATSQAWSLSILTSNDVRRHFGPYIIAARHPLCRNLDLTGIRWLAPAAGVGDAGIIPLIATGGVTLLGEAVGDGSARDFRMAFMADGANLQRSPAWPVLFHNLIRARAEALPGFRTSNLRAGQEAFYRAAPGAPEKIRVSVQRVDLPAKPNILETQFQGKQWSFSSPTAGLFAVNFGDDAQATSELVAFLFSSPEETDLRRATAGEWGQPAAFALAAGRSWRDDAWIFVLATLGIAVLHLVLATARHPSEKK
jgi:hypothetical protein